MKIALFALLFLFSLVSCSHFSSDDEAILASREIAERAFRFAEQYESADTEYSWGGQDALRTIKIDCSGLVVRCYSYALSGTEFSLVLPDMSSAFMAEHATKKVSLSSLRRGDLIFMGEALSDNVSHVALFEKIEGNRIYFIDSTQKDTNGDGVDDINGVTRRSYLIDDKKIKSGGIMLLKQRS